jgi:hypothetical protein
MNSCLVGSSEGRNERYDYASGIKKFKNGGIQATFNPEPKEVTKDGRVVVVWSNPYRFTTQFIANDPGVIRKGQIQNLKIVSQKTGKVLYSSPARITKDASVSKPWDENKYVDGVIPYDNSKTIRMIGFGVNMPKMKWENYVVSFDFKILGRDGNAYEQGYFSSVVKTEYNPKFPR